LGSGFDSGLSALGAGFDSGFDSGLSGFDVTMVVLLFWLPPPGAGPGKAWKIVEQALKMKAHWRPLNSPKVGALHAACRQGIPDWLSQKVLTFAHAGRCAILLRDGRAAMRFEDCVGCARGLRKHFTIFFHTKHDSSIRRHWFAAQQLNPLQAIKDDGDRKPQPEYRKREDCHPGQDAVWYFILVIIHWWPARSLQSVSALVKWMIVMHGFV
jgi:hypothetical protein